MEKNVGKDQEEFKHASTPVASEEFSESPISSITSWSPLKPGGASFKTHKFKAIDSHTAAFGSTIGARLFAMVFGGIGTAVAVIGVIMLWTQGIEEMPVAPVMTLFGGIFAGVGIYLYRTFDKAIIFDLSDGLFWKGKRPNLANSAQKPDTWCRIDEIAGIQVLREFVRSDKSTYYSYEINLVLKDNSRRHVIDHASLKQISTDAQQLGEFLQVPVWNGAMK